MIPMAPMGCSSAALRPAAQHSPRPTAWLHGATPLSMHRASPFPQRMQSYAPAAGALQGQQAAQAPQQVSVVPPSRPSQVAGAATGPLGIRDGNGSRPNRAGSGLASPPVPRMRSVPSSSSESHVVVATAQAEDGAGGTPMCGPGSTALGPCSTTMSTPNVATPMRCERFRSAPGNAAGGLGTPQHPFPQPCSTPGAGGGGLGTPTTTPAVPSRRLTIPISRMVPIPSADGFVAAEDVLGRRSPSIPAERRYVAVDVASPTVASERRHAEETSEHRFLQALQSKIVDTIQRELQLARHQQMTREMELQDQLRAAEERAHRQELRLVRLEALVAQLKSEAEGELSREVTRKAKCMEALNSTQQCNGKHVDESKALRMDLLDCEHAVAQVRRRLADLERVAESTTDNGADSAGVQNLSPAPWLAEDSDKDVACSPGSTATISPGLSQRVIEDGILPPTAQILGFSSPGLLAGSAAPGGSEDARHVLHHGPPSAGSDAQGPWNGGTGGVPPGPAPAQALWTNSESCFPR